MTTTIRIPHRTCHVCGLPSWACSGPGFNTKIKARAENRFRRDRFVTVWCCSRACAIQANAMADLGPASHKWPITLAEYTAQQGALLDIHEAGADRTETISKTGVNTEAAEGQQQIMDHQPEEEVSVRETAPKRRGGRPRIWKSEAQRLRAYRERRSQKSNSAVPLASLQSDAEPLDRCA